MIECRFSDVSERDMDLLFLEEMVSSQEFLNIFLSKINLPDATVCSVEQSKVDVEYGESDMTVIVEKSGNKYGLLIEDKIDAIAMPNQSGRYMARGEIGKQNGDYKDFFVFIIAPKKYLEENEEAPKYPNKITYEECLEYFRSKEDNRSIFKVQQIEQAIYKQKHGYQVIVNAAVTDFWDKYITYKEEHYPDLWLVSKRGPKGINARWPHFNTVLDDMFIYHKTEVGYADMTILGAADKIVDLEKELAKIFGDFTAKGIAVVKTGKSAAIRKRIPEIDFSKPFENYENEIPRCFDAIKELCEIAKRIYSYKIQH